MGNAQESNLQVHFTYILNTSLGYTCTPYPQKNQWYLALILAVRKYSKFSSVKKPQILFIMKTVYSAELLSISLSKAEEIIMHLGS